MEIIRYDINVLDDVENEENSEESSDNIILKNDEKEYRFRFRCSDREGNPQYQLTEYVDYQNNTPLAKREYVQDESVKFFAKKDNKVLQNRRPRARSPPCQ